MEWTEFTVRIDKWASKPAARDASLCGSYPPEKITAAISALSARAERSSSLSLTTWPVSGWMALLLRAFCRLNKVVSEEDECTSIPQDFNLTSFWPGELCVHEILVFSGTVKRILLNTGKHGVSNRKCTSFYAFGLVPSEGRGMVLISNENLMSRSWHVDPVAELYGLL